VLFIVMAGVVVGAGLVGLASGIAACASLSDTSPLPSGDASDLDGGFIPIIDDGDGGTPGGGSVDSGPPPQSGRVRLANLLQGAAASAVDLCTRSDAPGSGWEGQKITQFKPEGLAFGEVSAHIFLPVPTTQGSKYQFRIIPVGGSCDGDAGAGGPLVGISAGTNTQLNQGGGLTVAVVGETTETTGEASPKGVAVQDVLSPPPAFALLRVIHAISDLPAFDVLVNNEIALQGVKYATAVGFPYDKPTGFAQLAGGVPEGATLTLRAGTTVRSFKVVSRVRRGVAVTLFATGHAQSAPGITLSLCSDRSPAEGQTLASCDRLQEVKP
jgi:hypothetical protein